MGRTEYEASDLYCSYIDSCCDLLIQYCTMSGLRSTVILFLYCNSPQNQFTDYSRWFSVARELTCIPASYIASIQDCWPLAVYSRTHNDHGRREEESVKFPQVQWRQYQNKCDLLSMSKRTTCDNFPAVNSLAKKCKIKFSIVNAKSTHLWHASCSYEA